MNVDEIPIDVLSQACRERFKEVEAFRRNRQVKENLEYVQRSLDDPTLVVESYQPRERLEDDIPIVSVYFKVIPVSEYPRYHQEQSTRFLKTKVRQGVERALYEQQGGR